MEKLALLFDLDGTLWDVCKLTYESSVSIAKKYNVEEPSFNDIMNGMGKTINSCSKIYFPNVEFELSIKLLHEISDLTVKKIKNKEAYLYPGVIDTLKKLSRDYDLYIVSNTANNDYANAITNYVGNIFKELLACGSINLNKQEGIKYLIQKHNIKNAIYIGDTNLDKISSIEADIPFIYCKYGFGNMKKSEYEINSFNEIEDVIKKIRLN